MMRKASSKCKLALCVAASLTCAAVPAPRVEQDIPYIHEANGRGDARRTLDLYLPARATERPPLVAFVHGTSWSAQDRSGVIEAAARALADDGLAAALLRYRLSGDRPLPAAVQDVSRALAWLKQSAERYGYDPQRIILAGLGAGGHIAALTALDGNLPRSVPAGVIVLGAPLDLERWAAQSPRHAQTVAAAVGARALRELSPLRRVRRGAPPFLVLSAAREPRHQQVGARVFVEALREAGADDALWQSVPERDFFSVLRLDGDNPATALVTGFARGTFAPELAARLEARRAWRRPPFTTGGFWRHRAIIREFPTDQRFYQALLGVLSGEREQLNGWPLRRYYAIDLDDYLDATTAGDASRAQWIAITNVNGERIVWRRDEITSYGPRLVIGLDGERNLFRLVAFYRMRMEYSWQPGPAPPLMARPLGAFVYFAKEPPERLRETIAGIAPEGIRLLDHDPLAPLQALPAALRSLLSERHNCVACHDFRGTGARAHHLTAIGAHAHGGYALPLHSYPKPVLRRFLFEQDELAREFGITANRVAHADAEALYRLFAAGAGEGPLPIPEKTPPVD